MDERQAGRGEEALDRQLFIGEDAQCAVTHSRGGDKELERRSLAQNGEIDLREQGLAHRVQIERVEQSGGKSGHETEAGPAPRRQQRRHVAHLFPEPLEPRLGFGPSAVDEARGQDRRVDRARARAADRIERDARLLEQAVEHPPGERAERAAALQGERKTARPFRRAVETRK